MCIRDRDIGDDIGADLEIRMGGLQRLQPAGEDRGAQGLVEFSHFDHQAAAEPRADALVERLELAGEAVAGDDDLLAGIEQRVDRVAELLLDRLALDRCV